MINNTPFFFLKKEDNFYTADSNAYVGVINKHINSSEELMRELFNTLSFPGYFGFNWNALYDCMTDFNWIDKNKIILIHKITPELPIKDFVIYIEILICSSLSFKNDIDHNLIVFFPEEDFDFLCNIAENVMRKNFGDSQCISS